jgi:CRISPR type III-A-associated protein Csm2
MPDYDNSPDKKAAAAARKALFDQRAVVLRMNDHPKEIKNIINNIKTYVKGAGGALSTHQLRNVFGEVKKAKDVIAFQLIRPNLAYIAARQDKNADGAREMVEFLDEMIQGINAPEDIEGGHHFFEAIVAYHKLYHSKNN